MPKINLITAPDRLHNQNLSILLVNPSDAVKTDFNQAVLNSNKEINLYLYEGNTTHLDWLITVSNTVDHIVLDISHIQETFWLLGYLLSLSHTCYISSHNNLPFALLNTNRIYDFKGLMDKINHKE